jgi:hypothetical protein
MAQLISKSGAPVVELETWVKSKNDAKLNALFAEHVANFAAGKTLAPQENLDMDAMFNQFFAETNQELV